MKIINKWILGLCLLSFTTAPVYTTGHGPVAAQNHTHPYHPVLAHAYAISCIVVGAVAFTYLFGKAADEINKIHAKAHSHFKLKTKEGQESLKKLHSTFLLNFLGLTGLLAVTLLGQKKFFGSKDNNNNSTDKSISDYYDAGMQKLGLQFPKCCEGKDGKHDSGTPTNPTQPTPGGSDKRPHCPSGTCPEKTGTTQITPGTESASTVPQETSESGSTSTPDIEQGSGNAHQQPSIIVVDSAPTDKN